MNNEFTEVAFERLRFLMTERYPNVLSREHELVLREGIIALAKEMLEGSRKGRIAVGLPCGQGKTTAIRAVLWAIAKLKLPYTVTVACYKVEQLCSLKRQLTGEDTDEANGDGIAPDLIGLKHSYEFNEKRAEKFKENPINSLPPNHASEPSEGHDRQFLLVTHEAVKAGNELPQWLERDLMFYDESLVISESRVLTLLAETQTDLFAEISRIQNLAEHHDSEKYGDAARWMTALKDLLVEKLKALDSGSSGDIQVLKIPPLKSEVVKMLRTLLPERNWPNVAKMLEFANEELRVRRDTRGHALITYNITVPDALQNVIITDASDPIRELVEHDGSIQRVEKVRRELAEFTMKGLGGIKRFDNVTVYHRRQSGGREAMSQDFRSEANKVMREVNKVIDSRPDEEFLIFTYKERDGVNFERLINKKLGERRFFDDMKERVHILTWGNETALNDYQHISNVIMVGVMLQPMSALAGAYMGQKRDLKQLDATDERTLRRIRYSEASHLIYQGANRGSMRNTQVDENGQSQAMPCNLWVIHFDKELKRRLDRVMPGAGWKPWSSEGSKRVDIYDQSLNVANYLQELSEKGVDRVSIRKLKSDLDISMTCEKWQRCRDTALENVPWHVQGRSLQHMFPAT